eukprot:TRINITY_DN3517_c0_g1_i1.p1 TRINITY_DN3517_c0_g1~~TRINITY_DN3517_c0_g1_i1.p1  ORF type:complete len:409 (+),score=56.13 TRINITY_DN3517_c0_g1_i1:147-1373(+)
MSIPIESPIAGPVGGSTLDGSVLIAILVSVLISNIVYALTGFGNAILLHVFWQIIFLVLGKSETSDDLVQVVVLNFIMSFISVFPLLAITRRDIHWRPLIWVGIPCFAGTFLGTMLLFSTEPAMAKRFLGIVFLIFSAWKLVGELIAIDRIRRASWLAPGTTLHRAVSAMFPGTLSPVPPSPSTESPEISRPEPSIKSIEWWISTSWGPEMSWANKFGSAFAGFASGLLRGMFGAGGPPLMIYVSLVQMEKAQVRALSNTLGVLMTPLSFALLLNSGGFVLDRWPSYLITVLGSIAGLAIGAKMFSWFDTATIMRGILVLLILASVVMLNPPIQFTLAVFILAALVVVGYIIWRARQPRSNSSSTQTDSTMESPTATYIEGQERVDDAEMVNLDNDDDPTTRLSSDIN